MVELADIFRRYGPEYRAKFAAHMPTSHLKVMEAIEQCRTAALGGHVYQCTACGDLEYSYHSCKNRHCPKCQNDEATHWLAQQRTLLLPVPYFLVTFTLPEALRPVARAHQPLLYNLLFQTSSAALRALALDPKYVGGQIGMIGVLHTWTREMAYHPHVHYLVPGGALAPDGLTWLTPRYADWLVPVHALSKLFRGKFQEALRPTGLLAHVPLQVWTQGWITHCQPAGTGSEVLAYFAPYLYRIAITNNRLVQCDDGSVTFRVKERTSHLGTHRTLPAEEFIRRFLQHVLPKRFMKVRYYGVLSPHRRPALAQSRTLLAVSPTAAPAAQRSHTRDRHEPPLTPEAPRHCRTCGEPLVVLFRLLPHKNRPP
jgi:hypothetical protein